MRKQAEPLQIAGHAMFSPLPSEIVELSRKVNKAALNGKRLTLTAEQLQLLVNLGLTELVAAAATNALKERATWQTQNALCTSEEISGSTMSVAQMASQSHQTSISSGMRPASAKLDARARAQAMLG